MDSYTIILYYLIILNIVNYQVLWIMLQEYIKKKVVARVKRGRCYPKMMKNNGYYTNKAYLPERSRRHRRYTWRLRVWFPCRRACQPLHRTPGQELVLSWNKSRPPAPRRSSQSQTLILLLTLSVNIDNIVNDNINK